VVAEALLFAKEREQWHFWKCCACEERFRMPTCSCSTCWRCTGAHPRRNSSAGCWRTQTRGGWSLMQGLDHRPVDPLPALAHTLAQAQGQGLRPGWGAGCPQGSGAAYGDVANSSGCSGSSPPAASTSEDLLCCRGGCSLHSGPASGTGITHAEPAEALSGALSKEALTREGRGPAKRWSLD